MRKCLRAHLNGILEDIIDVCKFGNQYYTK